MEPQRRFDCPNHVYFFVPDEKVNIACLAAYLEEFVDETATIKPSRHPIEPDRLGYTVGAQSSLSREGLKDVIFDSDHWDYEKSTTQLKRDLLDYPHSNTWLERLDNGPTPRPRPRPIPTAATPEVIEERRNEHEERRNMSIHYTISEDRSGTQDSEISRMLAPLAEQAAPRRFDPRVFGR